MRAARVWYALRWNVGRLGIQLGGGRQQWNTRKCRGRRAIQDRGRILRARNSRADGVSRHPYCKTKVKGIQTQAVDESFICVQQRARPFSHAGARNAKILAVAKNMLARYFCLSGCIAPGIGDFAMRIHRGACRPEGWHRWGFLGSRNRVRHFLERKSPSKYDF